MRARLGARAEREESAAVAQCERVRGVAAFRIDGPSRRDGLALAHRDLELAPGDGRGGDVEQERVAPLDRRGHGDRVGAIHALDATRRDGDGGHVAHRHADHVALGGHARVVAGGAEVAAVAEGDHADAGRLRFGHARLHRAGRNHHAEAAIAVPCGSRGAIANGGDRRTGIDRPGLQARGVAGVPGKVGDAVRLDAGEVGVDEDLGAKRGVVVRHAIEAEYRRREVAQRAGVKTFAVVHRA